MNGGSARALAAALLLTACSSSAPTATQVLVTVDGDAALLAKLRDVRAYVYAPFATDEGRPVQQSSFAAWAPAEGRGWQPFSFGVARGASEQFRLVIKGYASLEPSAPPVIERKLLVDFRSGETLPVQVFLADDCYLRAESCSGLGSTCAPRANQGVLAGECVPVTQRDDSSPTVRVSDAGDLDAGLETEAGPPAHDASIDAEMLAEAAMIEPDATFLATGRCAESNVCAFVGAYPCANTDGGGYTCQGQQADWPMPDTLPGAKYAPAYTSDEQVVTDLVTGLRWQRELPNQYTGCSGAIDVQRDSCTFAEAKGYCAQLTLAGGPWRVPSKIELESIVDEAQQGPAIDLVAFPRTPSAEFWTGSPASEAGKNPWKVDFRTGNTGGWDIDKPLRVRCVSGTVSRASSPTDRYVLHEESDTVSDTFTSLTWQRRGYPLYVNLEQALAYCKGLGDGKFRVPALKELLTLVDPTQHAPSLSEPFERINAAWIYWSASPNQARTPDGLLVSFVQGAVTTLEAAETLVRAGAIQANSYRVRCVRNTP